MSAPIPARPPRPAAARAAAGVLAGALALLPAVVPAQSAAPLVVRTFFSLRSAAPDSGVSAAVLAEMERLEKAAGAEGPSARSLVSVALDIDRDGRIERFVARKKGRPVAGTPWVVSGARGEVLGALTGGLIFVGAADAGAWPPLETFWQTSAGTAVVNEYAFSSGRYVRADARVLTLEEIDQYFRDKPSLERELEEFR